MSDLIVGIDLGTTNSAIACVQDGVTTVLPVHGALSMPSVVGLSPAGSLLIGQVAKNQLLSAPESTVVSIKRLMGQDAKVSLGGKEYSPEEISAIILSELKKEAEKALGQVVKKAVITVPAFFNEAQRKATQNAGTLAGLEVVRLINEPTAAALAYGADKGGDGETMLVYDLGGGTFDVSLVTVEQGVVEVRASHGDTHLGGDDFDELLVDGAIALLSESSESDAMTRRRLKGVMEAAKIRLSDEPFTLVREEFVSGDQHLDMEANREDYESLIEPLIEKTVDCVQRTLADVGMKPGQINKIMLVGGASRTPAVHRVLKYRLGLEPHYEINPDLIVAMGAAMQGAIIAGVGAKAVLVDISAHTYSIEAGIYRGSAEETTICSPIIPRNTPLPARKSEAYNSPVNDAGEIIMTIFQGESLQPEANEVLGEFHVGDFDTTKANNVIVVEFALDLNGLLTVTALERATGRVQEFKVDTKSQRSLDLAAARSNLAHLIDVDGAESDDDAVGHEKGALLSTAKSLKKRADDLMGAAVSEDDKEEITGLLNQTAQAIAQNDLATIHALNERLSDVLFYLED